MAMVTTARTRSSRRRMLEGEEEEEGLDRISGLPDAVLGEIVSLLPTKGGIRTQVLSSRWRPLWRSAPLNLDPCGLSVGREISRILSAHLGPGRRFFIPRYILRPEGERSAATLLDGWLRSPALDNLQELSFNYGDRFPRDLCPLPPPPLLPASVHRFGSSFASPASAAAASRTESCRPPLSTSQAAEPFTSISGSTRAVIRKKVG